MTTKYDDKILELTGNWKFTNDIVRKMESDDMNLEDMIDSYENGMNLINICSSELNKIEKRVKILIQKNNKIIQQDMEE